MITSFKCKDTKALSEGRNVRRFVNIAKVARRKLRQLEIALKDSEAGVLANTAFVSMISGAFAFAGRMRVHMMWKSLITTKENTL